jgi:signal transduction histidine kinase
MSAKEPVNILLVDDQPAKLMSYQAILESLGETLIAAGSARDALEHLLKKNIAVILIDVIMPDLDGFELATMIRNHPRFQTTAIIFVSAIAMTDIDRLKGYEHGGVDYVPVPVVPELLRAKVRVFAELYRKTQQLERLNAELERRVEERTTELAHANAELEQRVEERTREREMALAQVHQMQKLESLGQLTGGVAHDFNNVLMAVLGNLDMLARVVADQPKATRFVDAAIRAAERGTNLTSRMLAFAKRQELKPEIVDVPRLIRGMAEMLRSSIGPSIDIRTDFQQDLAEVNVDPNQLELAILNLALNARDAMPDGGRLIVAVRQEPAMLGNPLNLPQGDYVRIAVTDTGIGMSDEVIKRAPEPFFTTKGPGKGTGLGLSTVFGLAAQSGGSAAVSSTPLVGTTVELWLPIAPKREVALPADQATNGLPATRPCSVLLVDDDGMVASATAGLLEQLGHRVSMASSAVQALDMLQGGGDYDLMITDHAMPGMTGLELTRRARTLKPDLPIILATGYADIAGGEEPGVPRLDKPYRADKLAATLAAVLDGAVAKKASPRAAGRKGRAAITVVK